MIDWPTVTAIIGAGAAIATGLWRLASIPGNVESLSVSSLEKAIHTLEAENDRLHERVTELEATAEELRRLAPQALIAREILDTVPAMVYEAEPGVDGAWTFVSRGALGLTGYDPSNWMKDESFWLSIIHPSDRDRVLTQDQQGERYGVPGTQSDDHYRLRCADGHYLEVHDHGVLVRADHGGLTWRGIIVPAGLHRHRRGSNGHETA